MAKAWCRSLTLPLLLLFGPGVGRRNQGLPPESLLDTAATAASDRAGASFPVTRLALGQLAVSQRSGVVQERGRSARRGAGGERRAAAARQALVQPPLPLRRRGRLPRFSFISSALRADVSEGAPDSSDGHWQKDGAGEHPPDVAAAGRGAEVDQEEGLPAEVLRERREQEEENKEEEEEDISWLFEDPEEDTAIVDGYDSIAEQDGDGVALRDPDSDGGGELQGGLAEELEREFSELVEAASESGVEVDDELADDSEGEAPQAVTSEETAPQEQKRVMRYSTRYVATRWEHHEVDPARSALLSNVSVRGEWSGKQQFVALPSAWVRKLNEDSIKCYSEDRGTNSFFAGKAKLSFGDDGGGQRPRVAFTVRRPAVPESVCDLRVLEVLSPTGYAPTFYEAQIFADATYVLTEGHASTSLDMLIDEAVASSSRENDPCMPPSETLPILIELLRALTHMADAGIVHGDLTEEKIEVDGLSGYSLVSDFKAACFLDSTDPELRCDSIGGLVAGSAYRHAPEMLDGAPTALCNNVWQVGLIFAKMNFGFLPTEHWISNKLTSGELQRYDSTIEGRDAIRKQIADGFRIQRRTAFKKLSKNYKDLMDLMAGMLEPEAEERWTADEALERAIAVAAQRGVPVLAPRKPAMLPAEWYDSFE